MSSKNIYSITFLYPSVFTCEDVNDINDAILEQSDVFFKNTINGLNEVLKGNKIIGNYVLTCSSCSCCGCISGQTMTFTRNKDKLQIIFTVKALALSSKEIKEYFDDLNLFYEISRHTDNIREEYDLKRSRGLSLYL